MFEIFLMGFISVDEDAVLEKIPEKLKERKVSRPSGSGSSGKQTCCTT